MKTRRGRYAGCLTITFCARMLELERYKVRDHFQVLLDGRRPEDISPEEIFQWLKEIERHEKGKSRFAEYGLGSSGLFQV